MNLRTLLFTLLLTSVAVTFAQTPRKYKFLVKEVGEKAITLHYNGEKRKLAPRDTLSLKSMISIPKGGKLVVYDYVNLRELTIKEQGMKTLAKFLDASSKESYTKVTFAGLIALLFSNNQHPDASATIYRGVETGNNSLDEYVTNINEVLKDPSIKIPAEYATILNEVLGDIEGQCEMPTDTSSPEE